MPGAPNSRRCQCWFSWNDYTPFSGIFVHHLLTPISGLGSSFDPTPWSVVQSQAPFRDAKLGAESPRRAPPCPEACQEENRALNTFGVFLHMVRDSAVLRHLETQALTRTKVCTASAVLCQVFQAAASARSYLSCCGTHHSGRIFWMRSFRTTRPHCG